MFFYFEETSKHERRPPGTPASHLEDAFSTLKRGANKLCTYGAGDADFDSIFIS
jgi:hypothetical protein